MTGSACPPFNSSRAIDGGHGARAPLPTLRCIIKILDSRDLRPDLRQLALEGLYARQRCGLFLVLGKPQADDIAPATAEAARHQNDRVERERRAFLRRVIEMDVEVIRQRQRRL